MSDLRILRELFRKAAIIELEEGYYGKKMVTLSESEDFHHKGYSVVIHNMPEDAVVIKTDIFPSPNAVFNNGKGACKRADFVIVANTDVKNVIIFIEMKKGKGGSEQEIIQQLKGAWCFIDYCRSIGQKFWNEPKFLTSDRYLYRFVSIRDIGINKKSLRTPHPKGVHDCPERMLKITSPHHLQFNQLIGAI